MAVTASAVEEVRRFGATLNLMTECSVPECVRPVYARGLCAADYQRLRYHGELNAAADAPADRACERCGVAFTPKTLAARTQYCSSKCKDAARAVTRPRPSRARGNSGSCIECGASLQGKHSQAIYCSTECRQRHFNGPGARPSQATENTSTCRCGKSLAGRRPNVRWCSTRCTNLWNLYKITAPEVDALLAQQGGGCAICGTTEWGNGGTPSVDHCHNSLRIRGILCARCNGALGLLDDDVARMRSAVEYLERDAAMT